MSSPELSSPPPRRRRRYPPRKSLISSTKDDAASDLAKHFQGLRPVQEVVESSGQLGGQQQRAARGGRGETRDEVDDEEKDKVKRDKGKHRADDDQQHDALLPPALRRPHNPLSEQLDHLPFSSLSGSNNLDFPPAAQAGPSRPSTVSSLTPLPSAFASTSSAHIPNFDHLAPAASPPPPKTLSPATILRSRRGSVHNRLPDPNWAARVLSPIVRAELGAIEEKKQKEGKGTSWAKERAGWRTMSEGSDSRDDGVPLSVDEFLFNVLPLTKAARQEERRDGGKKGKGKAKESKKRGRPRDEKKPKPQKRDRRVDSVSDEEEEPLPSVLFDPADFVRYGPPPTPRPLHRASTFLGAFDLDGATSMDKSRLLRRAPYAAPEANKHKLSMDAPSRTIFGQKGGDGASSSKKRHGDEAGRGEVKRLKPGQSAKSPFLSSIGQTAFAPLVNGLEEQRKPLQPLGELDEQVDRIVEAEGREERKARVARAKKPATMIRPGGGRVTALTLTAPEDAGAAAEVKPRARNAPPPRNKFKPTLPRKLPSTATKYRFTPRRLPPPRRAFIPSSAARQSSDNDAAAEAARHERPLGSDSPCRAAKAKGAGGNESSSHLKPLPVMRKQQQTAFRFEEGVKAKRAPTIATRQRDLPNDLSSSSQVLHPWTAHDSPLAGQSRASKLSAVLLTSSAHKQPADLVAPAAVATAGECTTRRATSDLEGQPKLKKRRRTRLNTRPDFLPPTSIDEQHVSPEDQAMHQSSHEYEPEQRGRMRSTSLPPRLDGRDAAVTAEEEQDDEDDSPTKSRLPSLRFSPELGVDPFPPAAQDFRRPTRPGYNDGATSSFEHLAVQAAQEAERLQHAVRTGGRRRHLTVTSTGPEQQYQQTVVASAQPQPHPLASSASTIPLWSRVPSLRFTPSVKPSSSGDSANPSNWSGLTGVDSVRRLPTPYEEQDENQLEQEEEQPPASCIDASWFRDYRVDARRNEDDEEEETVSPTSLASGADLRPLASGMLT
ncbi:hypothetical protein JCM8097_001395 [Rhodosporidiobolus ruineniae]